MRPAKNLKTLYGSCSWSDSLPRHAIPDQGFSSSMKTHTRIMKMIICFVIKVLDNKTITLLNLAEYCLILGNLAYGLIS